MPVILYFHGLPGGPEELAALPNVDGRAEIVAVDRLDIGLGLDSHAEMLNAVAQDILLTYPNRKLRLIGFSLGSVVALQLAGILKKQTLSIDLISVAAPLELGNFLPDMAGKPVFTAAAGGGWKFGALSQIQAIFAPRLPQVFFNMLFASAKPADKGLAEDPAFRAGLKNSYSWCLSKHLTGYKREVRAYVQPWADVLDDVNAPVTMWHGVEDNWSPIQMAYAVQERLGERAQLTEMAGLSHYSTLAEALPKIVDGYRAR
ncbi:MAG: alpha/beta hydrolase [Rhodobacteraceae bacterium]|nr:alpha/beta hydrolase [Paracoccaceae bacterium]